MNLTNKIDFALVFTVNKANPNGDPLNGNRPRADYEGYGEVSDVCLKRKIRNRLQDMGEYIFVQSDGRENDKAFNDQLENNYHSLKDRADGEPSLAEEIKKGKKADADLFAKIACKKWIDVRAFGQVFAFKKGKSEKRPKVDNESKEISDVSNKEEGEKQSSDSVSVGVRGPVTIQTAVSVEPVEISSMQITKSVNLETNKEEPNKKGPDTMGMKHRVDKGTYITFGSINCQLAEKTEFSDEDAEKLHEALKTIFENDASAARPDGSMEVVKVLWWKHNCKSGQYSSAKVHRSFNKETLEVEDFEDLKPDIWPQKS